MGGVGMEDYGIGGWACKTGSTGRDCKCLGWSLEWRGARLESWPQASRALSEFLTGRRGGGARG